MVSITLAVSPEIKREMDRHQEINWSGFIRQAINAKVEELTWREKMLEQISKTVKVEDQITAMIQEMENEPKLKKEYEERIKKARKGPFVSLNLDEI